MAVYTDQELQSTDVFSILDKALYLESGSSMITPQTVAVTENSAVHAMVVRFGDIEALSEEYGCDYIDAMVAVAEANEIDPKYLAVAVDEAEIIENPDLIGSLDHVVINPISSNDPECEFCESCFDAYLESGDEQYLEYFLTENAKTRKRNRQRAANQLKNSQVTSNPAPASPTTTEPAPVSNPVNSSNANNTNKSNFTWKHGLAAIATGAALKGLVHYANKPNNVISRKIAALRNLARKITGKAQYQPPEKRNFFSRILDKIKEMINRLMMMLHKQG